MKKLILRYLKKIALEAKRKREKAVLSLLETNPKANYLDCGCGDGKFTLEMAKRIGASNINGIEVVSAGVKTAQKHGVKMVEGDLNSRLPFTDRCFDVITAVQVVEHLCDLDVFVSEIKRILKPAGYLVISTENLASWHNIFALILSEQPSTGPFISQKFSIGFHPLYLEHLKTPRSKKPYLEGGFGHTKVMTYKAFKELFIRYRFRIIDEVSCGFYPFGGKIADFLAQLDKKHGVNIILKLTKK